MPWIPRLQKIDPTPYRDTITEMTLLTVDNLSVHFHTRAGVVKAVDNVSFSVNRGETLAIVGESGSGKSVTCYSLLKLIPCPPGHIASGRALLEGKDLLQMPPQQLQAIRGHDIAVVFQDPMTSLNPYLTIGEQLIEPLQLHKNMDKPEALARAIELLEEVGIRHPTQRIHHYPHQFSGGMRQRVLIAMALAAEPKLLICDEPTTALDVTIQAQILKLVKALQTKRNIGVIFISHDLAVVAGVADRVAVMKSGQIVEQNTSNELFSRAEHPYTQKLLSSVPTGIKSTTALNSNQSTEQPSPQPLLTVSHVVTKFGKNIAVNDISLTMSAGEILGLVGESGSGKSTLGRSILQLVKPQSGSIQFEGQELTQLTTKQLLPFRQRMQMIFQDPYASLNPRMTVFDTLAEPLLFHKLANNKTIATQVGQLMDDVGLARTALKKYPHEFSGGQRQRIAIGRAIATQPQLIIADEPVSALDVTIQAQILELLLTLTQKHQLSMLFISHDLSVVRYLADRIMVMQQGKLVETGTTAELFSQPQQPYTQQLLSAVPLLPDN